MDIIWLFDYTVIREWALASTLRKERQGIEGQDQRQDPGLAAPVGPP